MSPDTIKRFINIRYSVSFYSYYYFKNTGYFTVYVLRVFTKADITTVADSVAILDAPKILALKTHGFVIYFFVARCFVSWLIFD